MLKKKYYFIYILIFFIIIQCEKNHRKTLENYFRYLKNSKYKKAYELLSSKDKNIISFEEYNNEKSLSSISKNIIKRIKYNIIDISISESKKVVLIKVQIIQPDLVKLYTLIPELLNNNLNEKQIDKLFQANEGIVNKNYLKLFEDYKLIFEENRWLIDAGYEKKKYIYDLFLEADRYYKDNNYIESLEAYNKVLDFELNDFALNNKAFDRVEIINEKLQYIKKFIKINCDILKNNKNGVIIDITVKNTGTIVVKKIIVEFLFYCDGVIVYKDKRGLLEGENQQIGFNEEVKKQIGFNSFKKTISKLKCVIYAIDF